MTSPSASPEQVTTVTALRDRVRQWRADGLTIGLVPTMGALHHGHLSLVTALKERCDRVVVSIFVNPTQFSQNEDLDRYPRQEAEDCAKLAEIGADLVYLPGVSEIYPDGFETSVHLSTISRDLEGANRPGHFDGVATVVTKLLLQCLPDRAIFGEKDYQQLQVIRRLVRDLNIPVEIDAGHLVREPDGLAASSRNAYLTAEQRLVAPALFTTLVTLQRRAIAGEPLNVLENEGVAMLQAAGFDQVDYLSFRDADSLKRLERLDRPARLLAVARLGSIRLLDNIAVEP